MKSYEELLLDAQKYAAEKGARLILEFFFWVILLFIILYGVSPLKPQIKIFMSVVGSIIATGIFTSFICYRFFCKNWKRIHIWYFKKQIEIQYELAKSFLDPEKTECIVQKSLKDYFEKRQSEILAEAKEEDIIRTDEYIDSELAILEASEPVLYKRFWNQTVRKGEAHLEEVEYIQKILEEY